MGTHGTHSQQRKHTLGAEVGRVGRPQALREVSDNPDGGLEDVGVLVAVGRQLLILGVRVKGLGVGTERGPGQQTAGWVGAESLLLLGRLPHVSIKGRTQAVRLQGVKRKKRREAFAPLNCSEAYS